MSRAFGLAVLVLALAALPSWAVTQDEVVKLTKAGVSDELILELMKTDGSRFSLDAAALDRLRGEGVSAQVLQRMQELSQPAPAERAWSPLDRDSRREHLARTAGPAAPLPATALPAGKVQVVLRSEDERVKAWAWDPARREVRFYPKSRKDATDLARGAPVAFDIEPGVIAVRWDSEYQHYRVSLLPGVPMELVAAPATANGSPAIRLAILRGGRFYGATNLKVFYGRPAPLVRVIEGGPPSAAYPPGVWVPAAPATVIVQPAREPATRVHFGIGIGASFHD